MIGGVRMSDTIYRIIPKSHDFFPVNTQAADGTVNILKMYVKAERISWKSYDDPIFVDCGGNLESITCPYCGDNIEIDDWQEMMSTCYERSSFNYLDIILSCCNREASLNNLKYQMDCGFAKFVIEILNPVEPPCKYDLHEASKCFGKLELKMIVSRN